MLSGIAALSATQDLWAAEAAPPSEAQGLSARIAQLTEYRRRLDLDACLAQALFGLFKLEGVRVLRPSGDRGQRRWWTRAQLGRAGDAAAADAPPGPESARITEAREQALAGQIVSSPAHLDAGALLPLYSGSEITGILELRSRVSLDTATLVLIQNILRIYRNVQGLLDYSERDMLTGLLNRKTFDQLYFELSDGSGPDDENSRSAGRLWSAVVDVDHFKKVNDRYGHLIGDEVLLLLARLMKQSFREQDALFRFGGEEFVILLRAPSEHDAREALERFRTKVQSTAFPQIGTLTVSIGFAAVDPDELPNVVLGRADQAVYYAKHHGRNQVHGYEALLAENAITALQNDGGIELF